MNPRPVLVVPACEPGRGGGHLIRCVKLVRDLRALGRETWLALPAIGDGLARALSIAPDLILSEPGIDKKNWRMIILDRFQTPPEELNRWQQLAPVIGIDEGGGARIFFDFLIDIIPDPDRADSNIADPSLLPLPRYPNQMTRYTNGAAFKILISFGMEDTAGLGLAAAQALAGSVRNAPAEITLLQRQTKKEEIFLSKTRVITAIPNLSEHLSEYNLVITHYGLTAFEALYAGVPALLISPSAYHEKLAKAAGFRSLGTGKAAAKKLPRLLLNGDALNDTFIHCLQNCRAGLAKKHKLDHAPERTLAALINSFAPDTSRNCPACGAVFDNAIPPPLFRFSERSYYRCKRCGGIGMNRLNPPPIEYEREYFFELYQKQYGKTYIEDFPNLTAMARRRLSVITTLLASSGKGLPALLDIGCAYGPFLAAAKAEGFSPFGIDPAADAVRYVTQTLNIPATHGFFPNTAIPAGPYDVITLWYVIEHFRDCIPVLAEIRQQLKPGGIVAFATPSCSGISGRASLRRFLERSPADHWTIWSPRMCVKALRLAGFTVQKIVISGHHPERFLLLGKFAGSKKSPLYRLLLMVSKLFALGDTFEVYAVNRLV